MDPTLALLSILGTLAIGAMSPGPSFVVVVRASAGVSRRDGLAAALGMGCGGLVFAGLALAGLQALAGLGARTVDTYLTGPQQLLQPSVGERREAALEPAVEPDFAFVAADFDLLNAAHVSPDLVSRSFCQ